MTTQNKWVYAVGYSKKRGCMVGHPFPTRSEAEKHLPLYRAKGWTGGVLRLKAPTPPTEAEKRELQKLQKFTNALNGLIRKSM